MNSEKTSNNLFLLQGAIIAGASALFFGLISIIFYIIKLDDPDSFNVIFILPVILCVACIILYNIAQKKIPKDHKLIKPAKIIFIASIVLTVIVIIVFIIYYSAYADHMGTIDLFKKIYNY